MSKGDGFTVDDASSSNSDNTNQPRASVATRLEYDSAADVDATGNGTASTQKVVTSSLQDNDLLAVATASSASIAADNTVESRTLQTDDNPVDITDAVRVAGDLALAVEGKIDVVEGASGQGDADQGDAAQGDMGRDDFTVSGTISTASLDIPRGGGRRSGTLTSKV